jgi:hypothetical protein
VSLQRSEPRYLASGQANANKLEFGHHEKPTKHSFLP